MKLIPYNRACHEAGWPLATVTLRVVASAQTTTMTIALPQWVIQDGEVNPDYMDCDGTLYNCGETEDLYEGWAEPGGNTYEVLSIRPFRKDCCPAGAACCCETEEDD